MDYFDFFRRGLKQLGERAELAPGVTAYTLSELLLMESEVEHPLLNFSYCGRDFYLNESNKLVLVSYEAGDEPELYEVGEGTALEECLYSFLAVRLKTLQATSF